MQKAKVLSIVSLGLLAVNIVLVWFLFSHKPPGPRGEGPKKMVIEKLHLDEGQMAKYEELIQWHRAEIGKLDNKMLGLKNQLYQTLNQNVGQPQKDSLMLEIGELQAEIEKVHYKHFEDIKSLCKPEQMPYFKKLSLELAELFGKNRNRKGRQ